MSLDAVIRDATESDMLAVQRIYAPYVSASMRYNFEEEPPSSEELARRRASIVARGLPYLVAEINGEVVGYSYAAPYRERAGYRFTIQESVYVQEGLGGRGIGNRLLSALIVRCRALGFHRMLATIVEGNDSSVRLHERLGFVVAGRLEEIGCGRGGERLTLIIMQRAIGA